MCDCYDMCAWVCLLSDGLYRLGGAVAFGDAAAAVAAVAFLCAFFSRRPRSRYYTAPARARSSLKNTRGTCSCCNCRFVCCFRIGSKGERNEKGVAPAAVILMLWSALRLLS